MKVLGDVYYNKLFENDLLQSVTRERQVVNNDVIDNVETPGTLARIVYKLGTIGVTFGHGVKQFAEDFSGIPLTPLQIGEYVAESDNRNAE